MNIEEILPALERRCSSKDHTTDIHALNLIVTALDFNC
jgi:hypothetical protein